ncbi:MAG: hypothetical protein RMM51_12410, partial [Verrucomicrobiae bacterium]|nr:hypothetical protein [Verrucomicrobiae bacterium]
ELVGAKIYGGILSATSGVVRVVPTIGWYPELRSVWVIGQVEVLNGADFWLSGVISNSGVIGLKAGGNVTTLRVADGTVLAGGGVLDLGTNLNGVVRAQSGSPVLTNRDNTIRGAGRLGNGEIGLENRGTIIADQPVDLIIDPFDGLGFLNAGTLHVSNGSTLNIVGVGFQNFNSANFTLSGGTYRVAGTLKFDSAKVVRNAATIILDGPSSRLINHLGADALSSLSTNVGQFTIQNGRSYSLSNSLVNFGTFAAESVNSTLDVGAFRYTQASGMTRLNSNLTLGNFACTVPATVEVTGGVLYVTNSAANATLEVRSGTLTINGGAVVVNRLVMTNACARLIRTAGTLQFNSANLGAGFDADGDGMPNGFEQPYGLDPFNPADAARDDDGDGQSNLHEFLAGSDPINSDSSFRVVSITRTNNDIRVTWTTVPSKSYVLERSASVMSGYSTIFAVTNSTGTTTNYVDLGAATNQPTLFYRVRLLP